MFSSVTRFSQRRHGVGLLFRLALILVLRAAIAAKCDPRTLGWCGALPGELYGHSLTAISEGELVAYGGRRGDGLQLAPGDKIWLFDIDSMAGQWNIIKAHRPSKVPKAVPSAQPSNAYSVDEGMCTADDKQGMLPGRWGHAAAALGRTLFVFGGATARGQSNMQHGAVGWRLLSDLLAIDIDTGEVQNLCEDAESQLMLGLSSPRPRARISAALAVSPFGERVYIAGGWGAALQESSHETELESNAELRSQRGLFVRLTDVWVCNLNSGKWRHMEVDGPYEYGNMNSSSSAHRLHVRSLLAVDVSGQESLVAHGLIGNVMLTTGLDTPTGVDLPLSPTAVDVREVLATVALFNLPLSPPPLSSSPSLPVNASEAAVGTVVPGPDTPPPFNPANGDDTNNGFRASLAPPDDITAFLSSTSWKVLSVLDTYLQTINLSLQRGGQKGVLAVQPWDAAPSSTLRLSGPPSSPGLTMERLGPGPVSDGDRSAVDCGTFYSIGQPYLIGLAIPDLFKAFHLATSSSSMNWNHATPVFLKWLHPRPPQPITNELLSLFSDSRSVLFIGGTGPQPAARWATSHPAAEQLLVSPRKLLLLGGASHPATPAAANETERIANGGLCINTLSDDNLADISPSGVVTASNRAVLMYVPGQGMDDVGSWSTTWKLAQELNTPLSPSSRDNTDSYDTAFLQGSNDRRVLGAVRLNSCAASPSVAFLALAASTIADGQTPSPINVHMMRASLSVADPGGDSFVVPCTSWPTRAGLQHLHAQDLVKTAQQQACLVVASDVVNASYGRHIDFNQDRLEAAALLLEGLGNRAHAAVTLISNSQQLSADNNGDCTEPIISTYAALVFGGRAVTPAAPIDTGGQAARTLSAFGGSEWFEDVRAAYYGRATASAGPSAPAADNPSTLLSDAFILVWKPNTTEDLDSRPGQSSGPGSFGRWIVQPLVPGTDRTQPWPQPREGASMSSAWDTSFADVVSNGVDRSLVVMFGGNVQYQPAEPFTLSNEVWLLQLDSAGRIDDGDHSLVSGADSILNTAAAAQPPPIDTDVGRRQLQLNTSSVGTVHPPPPMSTGSALASPPMRWQLKYQVLLNQTTPAIYDLSPSGSAVLEVFNRPLVSLPDAATICASRPGGGYLATLLTAPENQRLAELANTQDVWLGLFRNAVPLAGGASTDTVSSLPELPSMSDFAKLERCQLNTSAGSTLMETTINPLGHASPGEAPRSYAWTWQDGYNNRTVADGSRAGGSGAGWTNWGRLEPDNKDGKEGQCVTMLSQGAVAGQWVDRSCDTLQAFACKRPAIGLSPIAGRRPRVLDYVGGVSNSSAAFLDGTMYWAPGVLRTWEEANEVCKQAGGWLLEARNSDIHDLAMRLCLTVRSAIRSTVSTTGGGCWFGLFSASGGGTEDYSWGPNGMRGKLNYPQPPWANTYPQKTNTMQCGALGMPAPAASATESAGWMNADCSLRLAFLCERAVPPAPNPVIVRYHRGRVMRVHGAKLTTSSLGEQSYVQDFSSFDDADVACQRVAMRLAPAPSLDHLADLLAAARTAMALGIRSSVSGVNSIDGAQLPQLFWLGADNGWGSTLSDTVKWLESQDGALYKGTTAGRGDSANSWPAQLGPAMDMWENTTMLGAVSRSERSCVGLSSTTGKLRLLPCSTTLPYICSSALLPDLVTTRVTSTASGSPTSLSSGSNPSAMSSSAAATAAAAVFAPATGMQSDRRATYAFFRTSLPFPDAAEACSDFGGHVVPVKSRDEDVYLSAVMARQLTAWLDVRGFWIGLRFNPYLGDGGSYDWEDPQPSPTGLPYSNFDQSKDYEPTCRSVDCCLVARVNFDAVSMAEARTAIDAAADVGNGAGDASAATGPLLTSRVDLKWASINCSLPRPFVCRRVDSDGQVHNLTAYISAHNVPLDWASADVACSTSIRAASLLPSASITFLRNRTSLALSVAYESGAFVPSLGTFALGSGPARPPPARSSLFRPPPRPPSPPLSQTAGSSLSASTATAWVWVGLSADRVGRWYYTDGTVLMPNEISQQIGDLSAADVLTSARWPLQDVKARLCLAVDLNSTRTMLLPCNTDLAYLCYGGLHPAASLLTSWGQELLVIGHRLPYADAETACQKLGAHLASFTADTPRTTGSRLVANALGSDASFWIGLDDNSCCKDCKPDQSPIGCYRWTDGRDSSLSYHYFDPLIGLPLATPTASTANCTAASANSLNVWTNRNCSDLLPALCMRQRRPPILYRYMDWGQSQFDGGQCGGALEYLFLNASASRTDAESACRAHNAHLVSLHSVRDMQLLANMSMLVYNEFRRNALSLRVPAPFDTWWIGLSYSPTGLITAYTINNASSPSALPPMRWTDQTPYDFPAVLPAGSVSFGSASILSDVPLLPSVTTTRDGWCFRTAPLQSLPAPGSTGDSSASGTAVSVDLIATQCTEMHQVLCTRPLPLAPVFTAVSGAYQLRFFSHIKLSKPEALQACARDSGALASPVPGDLRMVAQRFQKEFPSARQGVPLAWISAPASTFAGTFNTQCLALASGGTTSAVECQTELPFLCQRRLAPDASLEVSSTQSGYTTGGILGVSALHFYRMHVDAQRAANACYSMGGSLMTLRDDDEADALVRLIGGATDVVWSGMYWSAGVFYNVDGSEVAYLRWLPGEPSLVTVEQQQEGTSQYCVALVLQVGKTPGWRMRAVSCLVELPFVCREPVRGPSFTTLRGTQTVAYYSTSQASAKDAASMCSAHGMQLIRITHVDDVAWAQMTATRSWKPIFEDAATPASNASDAIWTGLLMRAVRPAGSAAATVSLLWWPGEPVPVPAPSNASDVPGQILQYVSAVGYNIAQGLLPGTFTERCVAISLQTLPPQRPPSNGVLLQPCSSLFNFMCASPISSPPAPDLAARIPAVAGSTFELYKTPMPVDSAVAVCRARGGRLTSIHSLGEEVEIMDTVQRHVGDIANEPRFWIGLALFNSQTPRWMDGSSYEYSNMPRLSPSSNTSQAMCYAVSAQGWVPRSCIQQLPFVCRVPDADSRWQYARRVLRAAYYYYYFTWRPTTELDADRACSAIDRYPVSFQSVTDLQELGMNVMQDVAAFDVMAINSTPSAPITAFWSGLSLRRIVVDSSSNATVLKYVWRDGTTFDSDSEIARFWQLPPPSRASPGSCISVNLLTGKAIFTSCLNEIYYICKGGTFPSAHLDYDGFRLSFYPEAASAVVAQSICASGSSDFGSIGAPGLVKGSLASLRTPDEERAVALLSRMATNAGNATLAAVSAGLTSGFLSSRNISVWLGLQDSASLYFSRFLDGTGVSYTNWAPGEPRGMAVSSSTAAGTLVMNTAGAMCARLFLPGESRSSAWYTAPCSQQELPFICKAVSPLSDPATTWTWGGWEYQVYVPLFANVALSDADSLGGTTFDVAQAACERVGASLMSVESTAEHEAAQTAVASWSKDTNATIALWVGVRALVSLTAGGGDASSFLGSISSAALKLEYVDGSERIWDGAGPPSAVLSSALAQWLARSSANASMLNYTVDGGLSAGCVAWQILPHLNGEPGGYTIVPCTSRVPAFICKRPGSKPSLVTIINDTRYMGYTLPIKWLSADDADRACLTEIQAEEGLWPSNLMTRRSLSPPRLAVLTSSSAVRTFAAQFSPYLRYTNTSLVHIGLILTKLPSGSTAAIWRDGSSYLLDWAGGISGHSELADSLPTERVCVALNVTSVALVKVACGTRLPYACSGAPLPDLVYTSNRASYLVFSTDLQREQARAVCKATGAGLSVFTPTLTSASTAAEGQLVAKLFKQIMPARSQFWTSLRAVSTSWSWQDMPTPAAMASNQNGSSPLGSYRAWSTGEPGTGLASGFSCAAGEVVEVGSGLLLQWKPVDCTRSSLPFICKVPLAVPPPQPSVLSVFDYNGYQYLVATPATTQSVSSEIASITCGQLGGRLALLQDGNLRMKLLQEALGLPTPTSTISGDMGGCSTVTRDIDAYIPQRISLKQANGLTMLALWTNMIFGSGRPRWADGTLFSEEQLALWDKSGQTFQATPPVSASALAPSANSSAAPPPSLSFGSNGGTGDQCGAIAFGRCSDGQGLVAWQSRACDSELGYVCERLPPPTRLRSRGSSDYLIYNHYFTQRQARSVCAAAAADLISLQDQQEQSWILGEVSVMLVELTRANSSYIDAPASVSYSILLGLDNGRYLDEFRWLDGSPFVYSAWAPGQPRNISQTNPQSVDGSFCVSLVSITAMWQVVDCTTQSLFVCKRPRTLFTSPPTVNATAASPPSVVALVQPPPLNSSTEYVQPVSSPTGRINTEPSPPFPPKPPAMPWRQGSRPPLKQRPPTPLDDHAPPPLQPESPTLQFDDVQESWPRIVAKPMWPTDPSSPVPAARQRHAASPLMRLISKPASNASGLHMFIYGGTVSSNPRDPTGLMDDLWLLQTIPDVRWTKMRCLGSPGRRLDASLQFHANALILTGGITFDSASSLWTSAQSSYVLDVLPLVLFLQSHATATLVPFLRWSIVDTNTEGTYANSMSPSPSAVPQAPPLLVGASVIPLANGGQVLQRLVYGAGTAVRVLILPRGRSTLPLSSDVGSSEALYKISVPMSIYPAEFENSNSITLHQRRHAVEVSQINDPGFRAWLKLAPRSIINCRGNGLLITSGDVHLQSLAFINCQDTAVRVSADRNAVVTIVDCWFEKTSGSAILVTSGQVIIQRTMFRENNGTAIMLDGVNATLQLLEHAWIVDNNAVNRSAGLAAVNLASVIHVHACIFARNYGSYGPAMYLGDGHGAAIITDTSFISNLAPDTGGGALFAGSGSILVHNSTFHNNTAGNGNGGAILCSRCTYLGIVNSSFAGNFAQRATGMDVEGGAVYADHACISHVFTTTFVGNTARNLMQGFAKGGGVAVSTSCADASYSERDRAQVMLGKVVFINNSADVGVSLLLRGQGESMEPQRAFLSNLRISVGDATSAPSIYMDSVDPNYVCDLDLSALPVILGLGRTLSPNNEEPPNATAVLESLYSINSIMNANTTYYACPSWWRQPLSQCMRQAPSLWTSSSRFKTRLLSPKLLRLSAEVDAPHIALYNVDSFGRLISDTTYRTAVHCLLDGCGGALERSVMVLPWSTRDIDALPRSSCDSCFNLTLSATLSRGGNATDSAQDWMCVSSARTGFGERGFVFDSGAALGVLSASGHILAYHAQHVHTACAQVCVLPSFGYTSYGNCVACWDSRVLYALVYALTILAPVLLILIAIYCVATSPYATGSIGDKGQRTFVEPVPYPEYAALSSSHLTDVLQERDGETSILRSVHSFDEQVRLSSCNTLPSWSEYTSRMDQQHGKIGDAHFDSDLSPGDIIMTVSYDLKDSGITSSDSTMSFDYHLEKGGVAEPMQGLPADIPNMRGALLYLVLLGLIGKASAAKGWVTPLRMLVQVAGLFSGVDLLGGGFISVACILDPESLSAEGLVYAHLVGWLVTGSLVAITPILSALGTLILQRCGLATRTRARDVFWACTVSTLLVTWPFLALESISLTTQRQSVGLAPQAGPPHFATYLTATFGWTGVALTCAAFPLACILLSHVTAASRLTPHSPLWLRTLLCRHTTHEILDWVSRFAFTIPIALWGSLSNSSNAFEQLAACICGLAVSVFGGSICCGSTADILWMYRITAAHLAGGGMLLVAHATGGSVAAGLEWAAFGFHVICLVFIIVRYCTALLQR